MRMKTVKARVSQYLTRQTLLFNRKGLRHIESSIEPRLGYIAELEQVR